MVENEDFFAGFNAACNLMNIEVDKILAGRYTRTNDAILDLKCELRTIAEMANDGESVLPV